MLLWTSADWCAHTTQNSLQTALGFSGRELQDAPLGFLIRQNVAYYSENTVRNGPFRTVNMVATTFVPSCAPTTQNDLQNSTLFFRRRASRRIIRISNPPICCNCTLKIPWKVSPFVRLKWLFEHLPFGVHVPHRTTFKTAYIRTGGELYDALIGFQIWQTVAFLPATYRGKCALRAVSMDFEHPVHTVHIPHPTTCKTDYFCSVGDLHDEPFGYQIWQTIAESFAESFTMHRLYFKFDKPYHFYAQNTLANEPHGASICFLENLPLGTGIPHRIACKHAFYCTKPGLHHAPFGFQVWQTVACLLSMYRENWALRGVNMVFLKPVACCGHTS